MQNGFIEYDTKKWMTNAEVCKLLGVGGTRVSTLATTYDWPRSRASKFVLYDRVTVVQYARAHRDQLPPPATKPKKAAPKKKPVVNVALHVDGKKVAAVVEKHTAAAPLVEKLRLELPRQLRALLEMHEVIPSFDVAELLRHVRAVVA